MSVSTPTGHASTRSPTKPAFTKQLERRILRFIQQRQIVSPGERVVVAVSGGPDSTALLVIISRLSRALDLQITAAHFEHRLRSSSEADADQEFVRTLAGSLEVPLIIDSGDAIARARSNHESIEHAARHLRYAFLDGVSQQASASAVVVGHTLDDQAETVLLHLLRGSGLDGISGMRLRAPWPFGDGPDLVRPLLCLRREDTERYCRDLGIEPRHDPTNDLSIATRNRIRLELLPALRTFNPRIAESLARLSEAATRDTSFIDTAANEMWQQLADPRTDRVSFPRHELESLHSALLVRLIRRAVAHLRGSSDDLEAVHIEDVLAGLSKRRYRLSLPQGLTAVLDSRSLSILLGTRQSAQPIPETALALPGLTTAGAWIIETRLVPAPTDPRTPDSLEAFLDADTIGDRLMVRSRRTGDRLQPLGLGGEKKVQDILVDAKVPATERDGIPIVRTTDGIAWVAGHCIDKQYALRLDSERAVHLTCTPLTVDSTNH